MSLANTLIYEGQLKCGSAVVEEATLSIDPKALVRLPPWLQQVLFSQAATNADAAMQIFASIYSAMLVTNRCITSLLNEGSQQNFVLTAQALLWHFLKHES